MSKKKSDEPTKSKPRKTSKKTSDPITVDGVSAAPVETLALKRRGPGGVKKRAAAKLLLSSDDIARRAYYISQRRRNLNLPGDELGDWVEAERQLREEAVRNSS